MRGRYIRRYAPPRRGNLFPHCLFLLRHLPVVYPIVLSGSSVRMPSSSLYRASLIAWVHGCIRALDAFLISDIRPDQAATRRCPSTPFISNAAPSCLACYFTVNPPLFVGSDRDVTMAGAITTPLIGVAVLDRLRRNDCFSAPAADEK